MSSTWLWITVNNYNRIILHCINLSRKRLLKPSYIFIMVPVRLRYKPNYPLILIMLEIYARKCLYNHPIFNVDQSIMTENRPFGHDSSLACLPWSIAVPMPSDQMVPFTMIMYSFICHDRKWHLLPLKRRNPFHFVFS